VHFHNKTHSLVPRVLLVTLSAAKNYIEPPWTLDFQCGGVKTTVSYVFFATAGSYWGLPIILRVAGRR
jgi:hypothetical protein